MANNCETDQTPTRLPSSDELAAAKDAIDNVSRLLSDLQWRVQRIARAVDVDDYPEHALVDGDEIPTFAHIGELYTFVLDARRNLDDEVLGDLDIIESKLWSLDTVRLMNDGGRS